MSAEVRHVGWGVREGDKFGGDYRRGEGEQMGVVWGSFWSDHLT